MLQRSQEDKSIPNFLSAGPFLWVLGVVWKENGGSSQNGAQRRRRTDGLYIIVARAFQRFEVLSHYR